MKKLAPLFSLFVLISMFTTSVPTAKACGPSFTVPVFAFETRPDLELESYAGGRIGIVQPSYNRSFLFAAYRYFNEQPFSKAEQKDLVSVWRAELYREDDRENDTDAAVKSWLAARKKVLTDEAEPEIYTRKAWGYSFFPNCSANAFEVAARTINARAKQYGAANENVQKWARAQDAVFYACSAGELAMQPISVESPAWLAADREYQIAATNFYRSDFELARAGFERIAADKSSVWSATADYLVARISVRQATLVDDEDSTKVREKRRPFYEQAEARLIRIIADSSRREFHEAANAMLNLVKYRLRPEERVHELAAILSNRTVNPNLRQDLIDYRWLLDRQFETANAAAENAANEAAKKQGEDYASEFSVSVNDYPTNLREDDVTDWILTFQSEDSAAFKHAYDKWRDTKSDTWLVAALAKAKKDSPETPLLIEEGTRVQKNSPAFAAAAFHFNRLLIETGKAKEARAQLDFILKNRMLVIPMSSRNAFLGQRMMVAETYDEFLLYAQRKAAAFSYDGSPNFIEDFADPGESDYDKSLRAWRERTMFDEDAVRVFNEQMPLAMLKQAVLTSKLPDYLKRNILIAAWTRAILLRDDVTAKELGGQFARLAPEFLPLFSQYTDAKTAAERYNAATYLLVKIPAFRPYVELGYGRLNPVGELDSYRDNWWCKPSETSYDDNGNQIKLSELPKPLFMTAAQFAAGQTEREAIKAKGNSSSYLARRTVEFATKSPNDERLAESLHLAVRATRYGCTDCETGKFSKQAHDILKKRFPRSEWAKKTPYWFKDDSCGQQ